MKNIKEQLLEIDDGRFADIIYAMDIKEKCGKCDYLNPHIKNIMKRHSCMVAPTCIAATLSQSLLKYMWHKINENITKKHYNQSID